MSINSDTFEAFYDLCNDAYECWVNHLELFDNNSHRTEIFDSHAGCEFARLSDISHKHLLLQIAKLHDRPTVCGQATLGVEFIFQHGQWPDEVKGRLEKIRLELDVFQKKLRPLRNQGLSHNDKSAIDSKLTLGEFEEGADTEYFKALQEFIDIVHNQLFGGPCPFDNTIKNDAAAFIEILLRGIKAPR